MTYWSKINMNLLQKSSQTIRAAKLIKCGFKTNIVVQDTGLSSSLIRTLYKEVQGQSPKAGQLPSPATILTTRSALINASIFIGSYLDMNSETAFQQVNINSLIKAHNHYKSHRKNHIVCNHSTKLLSINDSWVLAKALISKLITVHHCYCGQLYLTSPKQRTLPVCPFCHDNHG